MTPRYRSTRVWASAYSKPALPHPQHDDQGAARAEVLRSRSHTCLREETSRSPQESETSMETLSRRRVTEVLHASAQVIAEAAAIREASSQVRAESQQRLEES